MDLFAQSTYDAAHLYLTSAKSKEMAMLPSRGPVPTRNTIFEVVADGKIYRVKGAALQRWIVKRRQELGGPAGLLFRERPGLD